MSLTVFLSGYEYKNEYKYEREKRGKTVKQHSPANTIETKKRELNMLSSTQQKRTKYAVLHPAPDTS